LSDEEPERPRRILVIGSRPTAQAVDSFEWDVLPVDLNVADYDVVIMDLVPLEDEALRRQIDIERMPPPAQFARLIFSDAELVFIGLPHLRIGNNPHVELPGPYLPAFPTVVFESGQLIDVVIPETEPYFELVDSYSFHASEPFLSYSSDSSKAFIAAVNPAADAFEPVFVPLARTRFGAAVGFTLAFLLGRRAEGGEYIQGRRYQPGEAISVGCARSVLWLPAATRVSPSGAVDRLLASRYGLAAQAPEPAWLNDILLPAEIPIRGEIAALTKQRSEVSSQIDRASVDLIRERQFLQLLYEQGEDVLEPVVREALRHLGADVEDPTVKGREDGRLTDPRERSGILEIKGRTGSLRLSDVRELDQWVRDSLIEEGRRSKGILIFNGFSNLNPADRPDPFPSNCVQAAERSGIVLLTTRQVLEALTRLQVGKLNVDEYWDAVFGEDGVSQLPEFTSGNDRASS